MDSAKMQIKFKKLQRYYYFEDVYSVNTITHYYCFELISSIERRKMFQDI
jgi:hypothetical protein